MVKHTQAIHQQQLTNCLSVFDHLVGLVLKGLTVGKTINHTHPHVQEKIVARWMAEKTVEGTRYNFLGYITSKGRDFVTFTQRSNNEENQ